MRRRTQSPATAGCSWSLGAVATANASATVTPSSAVVSTLSAGGNIIVLALANDLTPSSTENVLGISNVNLAGAQASGAGVGLGLGIGASVATATVDGATIANLGGNATSGGSVVVTAAGAELATSDAFAVSGGVVSGSAAVADTNVQQDGANDASVQASLGSGTVLVSGNITVGSRLTALSNPTATGLALGAVSAAGSVTNAILTPDVQTFITGGSVTSTAGGISLTSLYNANTSGASAGTGLGATATSQASSGGLLAGSGANSTATDTGITDTNVEGGTLSAAGDITLLASSYASPTATSTGIAGGAIGVGATIATATANGSTEANMNGTTNGASSLTVTALGTELAVDTSQAQRRSHRRQRISGECIRPAGWPNDASVQASLGSGTVLASGNIAVSSDLNAEANATALGTALGAIAAAGSVTTATLTPLVQSFIAGGSVTSSSGGISLTSLYNANSDGTSAGSSLGATADSQASSGGLLAGSGANSTATDTGIDKSAVNGGTLSAAGGVSLVSSSYAAPTATSTGSAGGAIRVGAAIAQATSNGSTQANMDGTIASAGSLTLTALGTERATGTSQRSPEVSSQEVPLRPMRTCSRMDRVIRRFRPPWAPVT